MIEDRQCNFIRPILIIIFSKQNVRTRERPTSGSEKEHIKTLRIDVRAYAA